MKIKNWLSILIFTISLFSVMPADCQSNAPALSWQQFPEGIALALVAKGDSVIIHAKNTSSTPKKLLSQGPNIFALLYYVNSQGSRVLVSSQSDPAIYDDVQKNPSSIRIEPGAERSIKVSLSSSEQALIKTNPIICHVLLYDPATKQQSTIESSPQILTSGT
jgi:hypothetical protein